MEHSILPQGPGFDVLSAIPGRELVLEAGTAIIGKHSVKSDRILNDRPTVWSCISLLLFLTKKKKWQILFILIE